jgi:hypothetical protein
VPHRGVSRGGGGQGAVMGVVARHETRQLTMNIGASASWNTGMSVPLEAQEGVVTHHAT